MLFLLFIISGIYACKQKPINLLTISKGGHPATYVIYEKYSKKLVKSGYISTIENYEICLSYGSYVMQMPDVVDDIGVVICSKIFVGPSEKVEFVYNEKACSQQNIYKKELRVINAG